MDMLYYIADTRSSPAERDMLYALAELLRGTPELLEGVDVFLIERFGPKPWLSTLGEQVAE
jgi:hypothetical protein